MTITRLKLERFTAFESLDFEPSPGVNVLVGANGTGKTHLMKVVYAACDISGTGAGFAEKLARVFMPSGGVGRLVKRNGAGAHCAVEIHRGDLHLRVSFPDRAASATSARVRGARRWGAAPVKSAYIPAKEILANARGFLSLYAMREVSFEEVHADILHRAYLPELRGPAPAERRDSLAVLQEKIGGTVHIENETFFLRSKRGDLEFSLLAEGLRKLGLLWLLIRNGSLTEGTVLFWDEPETNLNPSLFGTAIEIFLDLQRAGVQIFIASHDYAILRGLDLRRKKNDKVVYHTLYREPDGGEIACDTARDYLDVNPNATADAFDDLYDREVRRSLAGFDA